jgi:uncharacterized phage-associated protein
MLVDHSRKKLLNAIVFFTTNTKYCGKTKLLKLLYFLDFIHFRETGRSVTGLKYETWGLGPVPRNFFNELNKQPEDLRSHISTYPKILEKFGSHFLKIRPRRNFDDQWFSRREIRILTRLVHTFRDTQAEKMVEETHLPGKPWKTTMDTKGKNSEIDYMLALDGSPGAIPPEEAIERMEDSKIIRKAFNAPRNSPIP